MDIGGSFPGGKRPGREADHSPPASAEVKKMWIYTSTPPYAFMAQCLNSLSTGTTLPLVLVFTTKCHHEHLILVPVGAAYHSFGMKLKYKF
jgi:hypothetical protein